MEGKKNILEIIKAYENLMKNSQMKVQKHLGKFFSEIDRKKFSVYKDESENFLRLNDISSAVEMLDLLKHLEFPEYNIKSVDASFDDFTQNKPLVYRIVPLQNSKDPLTLSQITIDSAPKNAIRFIDQRGNSIVEIEINEGKTYNIKPYIEKSTKTEIELRVMCYKGKVLIQEPKESFEVSVCCGNRMRIYNDSFVLVDNFLVRFVKQEDSIVCKYSVNNKVRRYSFSKSIGFFIDNKGKLVPNSKQNKWNIEKNENTWELTCQDHIYKFLHTKKTKNSKFSLPLLILPNMKFRIRDIYLRADFNDFS